MTRPPLKLWFSAAILILFVSCHQQRTIERAIYYWDPVFRLDDAQKNTIQQLGVKKIYIKFFDVVWNEWQKRPLPIANIRFDSSSRNWLLHSGIELVPVVFINNDCFGKIAENRVNAVGERINYLLKGLLDDNNFLTIHSVHFECDWTPSTKDKYFEVIKYVNMLPYFQGKGISAGIRWRQCRNTEEFGIPPVDRCSFVIQYPLNGHHSIDDLKENSGRINSYPLPLDVVVPISGGVIIERKNDFNGIITDLPDSVWQNSRISEPKGDHFEVVHDTLLFSHYLKKDDRLYPEKQDSVELMKEINIISPQLRYSPLRVILFRLDLVTFSNYNPTRLNAVYSSFNIAE